MTLEGWIVVVGLGLFLSVVVGALHRQNREVDRIFARKKVRAGGG